LPPSVFTHVPLKKVLKEVKSALPSGLFLTTALKEEDMWAAHQEARVVAAAIPQSIRQLSINPLMSFNVRFHCSGLLTWLRLLKTVLLPYGLPPYQTSEWTIKHL
jgi:hypothetical protein